ncbi:hypothetical protein D3C87_1413740 [compost metagenome]
MHVQVLAIVEVVVLVDFVDQPETNTTGLVEVRWSAPIPQIQNPFLELLVILQVIVEGSVGANDDLRIQRPFLRQISKQRKLRTTLDYHQITLL